MSQRAERSPARRVIAGLLAGMRATLLVAVPLLVSAGLTPGGTWVWDRGLVFVFAYAAVALTGNIALSRFRPAHFQVRQQGVVASREKRQPLADAIGAAMLVCFGIAWVVFIPIDVFHLRLLQPPPRAVAIAGGACALLGAALTPLAVWENRFATPNVQDQTAQGQRVVDTGVYSLIRHPIYAGNLLLSGGAALWLGSTAAFVGVGVLLVMTVGRIVIEERHLRAHLPGYEAYAQRVRSRLIPLLV